MKKTNFLLKAACIIACLPMFNIAASGQESNLAKKNHPSSEVESLARGYENTKNVALITFAFTVNTFLTMKMIRYSELMEIIRYSELGLLAASIAISASLFYAALKSDLHTWCDLDQKSKSLSTVQ